MNKNFVIAIDQGTTGTKVVLAEEEGRFLDHFYSEFPQYFPNPGWVEHDLVDIWNTVLKGIEYLSARHDLSRVKAIGITNQRETVGLWSKGSHRPFGRAIVWQDRRTADRCLALRNSPLQTKIQSKTGLLFDPYFSATKIEWAIQNRPDVAQAIQDQDLCIGTIDSFLCFRLTQGKSFVTDASNASRTLLMNLESGDWDPELLSEFHIPKSALPKICPNFFDFGKTLGVPGLPDGIPITGMIGDQQSALLGQGAVQLGQAKCTFGTGAFLLMNVGSRFFPSDQGLLTTVAWRLEDGTQIYALEGSAFMAGATVQWLRDGLKIIEQSSDVESLARSVSSTEGVVFVPSFTGLGAPYWDPNAKAMIDGMSRGTHRGHIAYAALEGIAHQNSDLIEAMNQDLDAQYPGVKISKLRVDGGASQNTLLMQMQADILGCEVELPSNVQTTAMGAVIAANLGLKKERPESQKFHCEKKYRPEISDTQRSQKRLMWKKAIQKVML